MNNDDRHRIKAQIVNFLTNDKICGMSSFYKYVKKHLMRPNVIRVVKKYAGVVTSTDSQIIEYLV